MIINWGKWEGEKAGEMKYVQKGGMISDLLGVATISLRRSRAEKKMRRKTRIVYLEATNDES